MLHTFNHRNLISLLLCLLQAFMLTTHRRSIRWFATVFASSHFENIPSMISTEACIPKISIFSFSSVSLIFISGQ